MARIARRFYERHCLAQRLQTVVADRVGKPGTVHGLEPLTGGANRSTLSFDADIDGRRVPLNVQIGMQTPDPVAGITPELRPKSVYRRRRSARSSNRQTGSARVI